MKNHNWKFDTLAIHAGHQPDPQSGAISSAIVPAVAYAFPDAESAAACVAGDQEGTFYGRYGNPTLRKLEEKIACLEGGEASVGLSSGMAAISSALLAFLQAGDHVLVTKDVYGGTFNFINKLAPRFGIRHTYVDCTDPVQVLHAIEPATKAIFVETPSNPLLTVLDLRSLARLAKAHGIPLIVDNTFMTPMLQRPLELGADVVVHSATKYLNGHGDVLAGFVVGSKQVVDFIRMRVAGDLGQNLNAWESFLILRGLKTLGLRVREHCASAVAVAVFLANHSLVSKVHYPGLPDHPQHKLAQLQMQGMGGIVSFEVHGGEAAAKQVMNHLELAMISFSLGDPETLIQHPASMTHKTMSPEFQAAQGITAGLLRLSVGLESPEDIIKDLDQALGSLARRRTS